jgi:hypothetical protein
MAGKLPYWIAACGFVLFAAVGFLTGNVVQMTVDNLPCQSRGYGNNNFLALCHNTRYGTYEHGAIYYGLEPGLRDNIRKADVIFLGTSVAMFAFSTNAVRNYFNDRNIRFFVMGFAHGEWSPFPLAVLQKWRASPKVLVINADPFFGDSLSAPAREALEGGPLYLWTLLTKMLFQRVHRVVCFTSWHACSETARGTFRSARNGQWSESQSVQRSTPVNPSAGLTFAGEPVIDRAKVVGETFINAVGVSRNCIVLTGVANSVLNSPWIAQQLATMLKTRSIFPAIDGLSTTDGAHFNYASAERWSSRLIEQLTPILQDCLPSAAVSADPARD